MKHLQLFIPTNATRRFAHPPAKSFAAGFVVHRVNLSIHPIHSMNPWSSVIGLT